MNLPLQAPWRGGRIRIGVSSPKRWNPLSPIIRWVLGTPYSHIWILLDDALFDMDMVLGAENDGFMLMPYDVFLQTSNVIKVYDPHPDYKLEVGLRKAVARIGEPYDKLGLIGMIWVKLGAWLKRKCRNPLASHRALFCSESVAYVLRESDVPEASMLVPEETDPAQVVKVLETMRSA